MEVVMQNIAEVVNEYLAITARYDNGRVFSWDEAYHEVKAISEKMRELIDKCETDNSKFITKAVYERINDEQKRLYLLAYNYKKRVKNC
jgi:hypothetical protein